MKISIDAKALNNALSQSITCKGHQITTHVLLATGSAEIAMSSTDLESDLNIRIPAEVSDPGTATIDPRLARSALNGMEGPVSLELNQEHIVMRQERRRFKLASLDPENFPTVDGTPQFFDLSAAALAEAIEAVMYAASSTDVRYYLNGVWLGAYVAASNGEQLAIAAGNFDLPSMIIPIRSAPKIAQALNMPGARFGVIKNGDNLTMAVTSHDSGRIASRLIDGRYPDIQRVTKDEVFQPPVTFNGRTALAALNRLMPFVEKIVETRVKSKLWGCRLHCSEGGLCFHGSDDNQETITASMETIPADIGLNLAYLREVAALAGDADITWWPNEHPIKVQKFTIAEKQHQHYIMPVRL